MRCDKNYPRVDPTIKETTTYIAVFHQEKLTTYYVNHHQPEEVGTRLNVGFSHKIHGEDSQRVHLTDFFV